MNQITQISMVLVSTNKEVTKSNQKCNLWAPGGKDSVYSGAKNGGSLAKIKASVALGTRLGLKDQNWGLWG